MKFPGGIALTSFIACTFSFIKADAQEIYAGRYNAILNSPPKMVPTPKTPDGALAGNGDIGLTLGGTPDRLQFYIGKNDFWRAYPVYPGGGIAHPGGLTVSIGGLKDASYYAEQTMDKAAIKGKFNKNNLQVELNTWVAATSNLVVAEFTANQSCEINLRLWSRPGNTSVNDSGYNNNVYWVTRSFENTPLLEWPCHVAMAMKIVGNDCGFTYLPLPEDDPRQRKPDITRAQTVLGWNPTIPLHEGLTKTVDDFKNRSHI